MSVSFCRSLYTVVCSYVHCVVQSSSCLQPTCQMQHCGFTYYPMARMRTAGLSNQFCPSVSQSVSVSVDKKNEIPPIYPFSCLASRYTPIITLEAHYNAPNCLHGSFRGINIFSPPLNCVNFELEHVRTHLHYHICIQYNIIVRFSHVKLCCSEGNSLEARELQEQLQGDQLQKLRYCVTFQLYALPIQEQK